jgi:hypothetical protein
MARAEQDREDLLTEAKALVQRAELAVEAWSEPVVVGFRANGGASVYLGQDLAWHFDSRGRLRRAFVAGVLYKAEHGRLVSLTRQRAAGEVQLVRDELSDVQQQELLSRLSTSLARLAVQLQAGQFQVHGQVPPKAPIVDRIRSWLAGLPGSIARASSPHAR